jgi:hypothetical protein
VGLGEGDEQGQEEGSTAQRVGSPRRGQQKLRRGHQNSRRRITKKTVTIGGEEGNKVQR